MKRRKRKLYRSDIVILGMVFLLSVVLIWFRIQMLLGFYSGKKTCQSLVSIEHMEYNETFLNEVQKIQGFCSVAPVFEIPVRMKAGDYTMDVSWMGTDLSRLEKKVVQSVETPIGSVPVLLLGESSLVAMQDGNGHVISETKQKEFLERFAGMEWEYCLASETGGEDGDVEEWKPCVVAGILSSPLEDIYLPYEQAVNLKRSGQAVTKILLTVQGMENHEKALGYFVEKTLY